MMSADIGNAECFSCVKQLIDFAYRTGQYYDFLVFHEERFDQFNDFLSQELQIFVGPRVDEFALT